MKTLGVCGGSYYAATLNNPPFITDAVAKRKDDAELKDSEGKHFSELLAKKLNYELLTLARGACSNTAIRLQISELVKRKVDFIIVGATTVDRIDYPRYPDRRYNPNLGIYNIYYTRYPDRSGMYFDANNPNKEILFSETITNIIGPVKVDKTLVRSEEQYDAIKQYFMELYDHKLREQQDAWIIASGIQEIRDAGIPYMILGHHHWLKFSNYFNEESPRHILNDAGRGLIPERYYNKDEKPRPVRRWHTSDETQIIIADKLYNHIVENNLLEI